MTQSPETERIISRRKLLKVLAATGGTAATTIILPTNWIQPIIQLEVLPPHAQVSPPPALCSGVVASYEFNGDAMDGSGHGHNGTVQGAVLTSDRYGHLDNAYSFDGSASYIVAPSAADLSDFGQSLSIVAWIRIASGINYNVYDYRHILSKGATYGDLWSDYAIGLSNPEGALLWEYTNATNNVFRAHTGIPISQNDWHFVAVTFNAGLINYYLDGAFQYTYHGPYTSIRSSSQPLYIGARYPDPIVGVFQGSIDDVRLYSCPLSEQEIHAIYQQEVAITLTKKAISPLTRLD